jgi:hypothetical protein
MSSSRRRRDEKLEPLPPDLVEYIRGRQKINAPLCPKCGKRKIENKRTGWCRLCTADYDERSRMKKRKYWHKRFGRDA